jgi:MarR family transcriptional regulator, negative regulator of the multidrug operon emrRAB
MNRTANLLGTLGLAVHDAQFEAIEQASGLTPMSAAALHAVGQEPGISIRATSIRLNLTHAGTVRVIDRLCDANYVQRKSGPDGRTVALHLTRTGKTAWNRQLVARAHWLERCIGEAPHDMQKQAAVVFDYLLRTLTKNEDHGERLCRLCDEASCPQDTCPVTCAVLQQK